jgi:hypothetical protein
MSSSLSLEGYRYDSVAAAANGDSLFFSFPRIFRITGTTVVDTAAGSILGKHILKRHEGVFLVTNWQGDSLLLCPHASVGESWHFSPLPLSGYMLATIVSSGTGMVLGTPDSLKTINLQAFDSLNNPATQLMNGRQIVLSKHHGIVQTFDLYKYPDLPNNDFTLAGTSQPRAGIQPLSRKETYSFRPGDVFHLFTDDEFNSGHSFVTKSYMIRTILGAQWAPDSLSVSYATHECTEIIGINYPTYYPDTSFTEVNKNLNYSLSPAGDFLKLPQEFAPVWNGCYWYSPMFPQSPDAAFPGRYVKTVDRYHYVKGTETGGEWKSGPYAAVCYGNGTTKFENGMGITLNRSTAPMTIHEESLVYGELQGTVLGSPVYADCNTLMPRLTVSEDTLRFTSLAPSTDTSFIFTNKSWSISGTMPAWATVNKNKGYGNDTLVISALEANPGSAERKASFSVAVKFATGKKITLIQAGKPGGIGEQGWKKIKVAPNPVEEKALITLQTNNFQNSEANYSLADCLGRVVAEGSFHGPSFIFQRNGLPGGIYYLRINKTGSMETYSIKIILLPER